MKVGILALQGDYIKHSEILGAFDVESSFVREKNDLEDCMGLIIPGGESTTITKLLIKYNLLNSLKEFAKIKNIFGTCAGSIIMSNDSYDKRVVNLNCINVQISRNSWGAQINSFVANIDLALSDSNKTFKGIFIRAPRILDYKDCVVLGKYNNEPVLLRNKLHLISTFHPELTNNHLIHKYFISMINEK